MSASERQVTDEMVVAADRAYAEYRLDRTYSFGAMEAALKAALSASPLVEENERLQRALTEEARLAQGLNNLLVALMDDADDRRKDWEEVWNDYRGGDEALGGDQ